MQRAALAQAADLDSANVVLRLFLADYNRRFARRPRDMQTAWRPAPENLDRICCFVHERVVSNDNIVQWEGQRFQIPQQGQRFSLRSKIHVYQALDGRVALLPRHAATLACRVNFHVVRVKIQYP